jgi:hypothetical protein
MGQLMSRFFYHISSEYNSPLYPCFFTICPALSAIANPSTRSTNRLVFVTNPCFSTCGGRRLDRPISRNLFNSRNREWCRAGRGRVKMTPSRNWKAAASIDSVFIAFGQIRWIFCGRYRGIIIKTRLFRHVLHLRGPTYNQRANRSTRKLSVS